MRWIVTFHLGKKETADKLIEFFKQKLDKAYRYRQELGSVIIENCLDKNNAWKTCLFVFHRSGLYPKYVIESVDENNNVNYVSTCNICRANTSKYPHHEHIK